MAQVLKSNNLKEVRKPPSINDDSKSKTLNNSSPPPKNAIIVTAEIGQTKSAPSPQTSKTNTATNPVQQGSTAQKPKEISNLAQFNLGLDVDFRQGNIDRRLLKARFSINYEPPRSIVGFSTNPRFAYGTFKRQLNERELFVDWNTTFFAYQRKLYYLAFGIFEKSNLRKINERLMGGVGFGYRIIGDKNHPSTRIKLAVTNAFVYEKTDFYTKSDVSVIRNSTRLKFSAEIIKGKLFFSNMTFFQPSLNKPNLRWNALSSLTIKASKRLGLNILVDNSYESLVPEGINNSDLVITFGLSYSDDFRIGRKTYQRPYDWWMK